MNKKTTIIILAIALLTVLSVIIFNISNKPKLAQPLTVTDQSKPSTTPASQDAQLKAVDVSALPPGMPANLPFEPGATVLQNFEAKIPATGKSQSTQVYVSKKTLDANFALYQKYLIDNGWTVTATINQPAIKNLVANKADSSLNITIASAGGKNTVNVTYVY